jgi:hypothetical protein
MGPKGLMLVFYRSADWCPYCKTQLAELHTGPDFRSVANQIVATESRNA